MAFISFCRAKLVILMCACTVLSACTAQLKEATFLAQDNNTETIAAQTWHEWQTAFPKAKLQKLGFVASDGTKLNGLYLDNADSEELIFFIQGNGMKLSNSGIKAVERLSPLGKDIIMFDHRGLGTSQGSATIAALKRDAKEQLMFVKTKFSPQKLYLHGYSLGSFIATALVEEASVDALILQGSATNVDDWISHVTPWYTKPFLTIQIDPAFHAVDNLAILSQHYTGPLLIIAGENDKQAPPALSKHLFDASQSQQKELIVVKDADHSGMFKDNATVQSYQAFLDAI
ncbi:alpha/beta hydrolase [Aestuariibacter sp. A3R04]|uniref:alpha/beta hydrolase n=1 Tax=Aestuariibacter sp. A3R04 TaxID=2841571 RepID=UPI001C08E2AD|nr:alpha/beta fold hydrolase [Aestuariibacter sp. A3R04]MBU3021616.1 lysophospholipase [Aestuariibacter sp. A3R04]